MKTGYHAVDHGEYLSVIADKDKIRVWRATAAIGESALAPIERGRASADPKCWSGIG